MNNDRGFSLIELIVVMVIVAIAALGSVAGYKLIDSKDAKNATERIRAALDDTQMLNMTKSKSYVMNIRKDISNGKYVLSILKIDTSSEIVSSQVLDLNDGEITFQYSGDSTQYLVSSVPVAGRQVRENLEVCFRKDTGGLKTYGLGIVSRIGITASGRTYYIQLVTITGKHFIE